MIHRRLQSAGTSGQIKQREGICGDSQSVKYTSGTEENDEETDIGNRKDEGYCKKVFRTCRTDKGIN